MIKNYVRPDSLEKALNILKNDTTYCPLAGGSLLSQSKKLYSVVDLQDCGLEYLLKDTSRVRIGAMTRLESMRINLGEIRGLSEALNIEAARNVREQATLGGTIITATGRSPLLTVLLGLDVELIWEPEGKRISIGNWLAQKKDWREAILLTEISFDLRVKTMFESIGRSPLDTPVLCTQMSIWPSHRMRFSVGGFGKTPVLVLDGNVGDNLDIAIESALCNSQDEWASNEYRIHAAKILAKRSLNELIAHKEQK